MTCVRVWMWLGFLCLLPAQSVGGDEVIEPSAPTARFVLAAGANDGGHERTLLRYAVSDAGNFADVMVQMGGVDEANRQLLINPDRAGFEAALADLARRVAVARQTRARTEVMLYYSGHADETGLLLGEERLGYRQLRQMLNEVEADVRIAVLDACASGAITRIKGGQQRAAFLLDSQTDTRGYAFLTSSSAQESAQESDRIGASYFTYYLVTGMRGAADVSADGRVTLSEAYQFALDETLARTVDLAGGAQHPAYDMNLSGTGDVVLTDVRRVSAGVVLNDDVEGRLFVRAADRRLVAELYKPAGRSIELGLVADDYEIYLETRRELFVARRQLADGERLQLATADFASTPR
ncbi:MAG: caspase family protein, partial [bacterium]|nr:caspase family protein [bacterium]